MRAGPTLDGRIRIDVETPLDRMILSAIPGDARGGGVDLAGRFAGLMESDPGAEDWEEFVIPDLREAFNGQLGVVEKALRSLTADEPGEIFILPDEAESWYGALNQARLALEERHHFTKEKPAAMTPGKRTAWYRSQFYQEIQQLVLEFLMRRR